MTTVKTNDGISNIPLNQINSKMILESDIMLKKHSEKAHSRDSFMQVVMNEAKDEVNIDKKNVDEQKETNKEPIKPLSPEEIETLKKSTKLIEDFGKYLGQEWKKKIETGTDEEISAEYRKLGALSGMLEKFLQERLQRQKKKKKIAMDIAKQDIKKNYQYLPELDEYFDKPFSKTNNVRPAMTLENAFGVKGTELGG